MLIRITNKCFMECNHCMIDSNPDGKHMNDLVFEQSIKFITSIRPRLVLVTGGEPTTHPNVIEWTKRLQGITDAVVLTSNGMFLDDMDMVNEIREMCKNMMFKVQITNDSRYYPKRINPIEIAEFDYTYKLQTLANNGRARSNNLPIARLAPFCFNLRSIVRSGQCSSLSHAIKTLESAAKFCQPSINYDGTISVGESSDCHIIGDVYDTHQTIFNNIKNMKCDMCGSLKNIGPFHRSCIGE